MAARASGVTAQPAVTIESLSSYRDELFRRADKLPGMSAVMRRLRRVDMRQGVVLGGGPASVRGAEAVLLSKYGVTDTIMPHSKVQLGCDFWAEGLKPTSLHVVCDGKEGGIALSDRIHYTAKNFANMVMRAQSEDASGPRLELVVLSGARTAEAAIVLQDHVRVPFVIAWTGDASNQALAKFSSCFYAALTRGIDVKSAFQAAAAYVRARSSADRCPNCGPEQLPELPIPVTAESLKSVVAAGSDYAVRVVAASSMYADVTTPQYTCAHGVPPGTGPVLYATPFHVRLFGWELAMRAQWWVPSRQTRVDACAEDDSSDDESLNSSAAEAAEAPYDSETINSSDPCTAGR